MNLPHYTGFGAVNCQMAVSGKPSFAPCAPFCTRAIRNQPVERPGKLGRIILDPQRDSRRSRYRDPPRIKAERETSRQNRTHRIVFLGKNVKCDELLRFPLLVRCQNGEGARNRGAAGRKPHGKPIGGRERLPRFIPHADFEYVVHLAWHRLGGLNQHLLERRLQVDGVGECRVRDTRQHEQAALCLGWGMAGSPHS